jgi:hypothetical protein
MRQEEDYAPTEKQEEMMRSLCRQLMLNFVEVTAPLVTRAAYSQKLADLLALRNTRQTVASNQVNNGMLCGRCSCTCIGSTGWSSQYAQNRRTAAAALRNKKSMQLSLSSSRAAANVTAHVLAQQCVSCMQHCEDMTATACGITAIVHTLFIPCNIECFLLPYTLPCRPLSHR